MADIPAEIMEKARAQCDLCGITPYSDMRVHAEHVAAFAIIEERNRCARVVEKGLGKTNTAIARAIRNGDAP